MAYATDLTQVILAQIDAERKQSTGILNNGVAIDMDATSALKKARQVGQNHDDNGIVPQNTAERKTPERYREIKS